MGVCECYTREAGGARSATLERQEKQNEWLCRKDKAGVIEGTGIFGLRSVSSISQQSAFPISLCISQCSHGQLQPSPKHLWHLAHTGSYLWHSIFTKLLICPTQ